MLQQGNLFQTFHSQIEILEYIMLFGRNMIVVLLMMKTFDGILILRCRSLERDLERLKADHATEVKKAVI